VSHPPELPDVVNRAFDVSRRAGYVSFCRNETGRLLAALAAALPPGARVLELGTGVGVGTAWLVEGLLPRTDVRVVSVELNPETAARAEIPNQVDKSIQTTRRFDALKLWLTLRIMGADAVGALLDEAIDLAARVGSVLAADSDFELAAEPQLSTLVFRYRPVLADGTRLSEDASDELNPAIRAAVFASGQAVVAGTKVAGRHYLKFTLLNAEATLGDILEIVGLLRSSGEALLAGGSVGVSARTEARA